MLGEAYTIWHQFVTSEFLQQIGDPYVFMLLNYIHTTFKEIINMILYVLKTVFYEREEHILMTNLLDMLIKLNVILEIKSYNMTWKVSEHWHHKTKSPQECDERI
ncbi:hypothetical protein KUTeg_004849 [Tegillarca granosa]|uniref:Uncharacterized protein n=1 Tax=Tegillarca granosa TaxID=220873 RepID=A0ABQ9FKZ1_TEGGR|nr:hypothetical protein KUTeg_004849 [Tegillarca granosa]